MKRRITTVIAALSILLLCGAVWARMTTMVIGQGAVTGGGGQAFAEDWNCGDSDSPTCDLTWTELSGDADISGNALLLYSQSYEKIVVVSSSALNTANGYCKFTYTGVDSGSGKYVHLVFRYTNNTSKYYYLEFQTNENVISWGMYDNVSDLESTVLNTDQSVTVTQNDSFGVTWTGTGDDTVIRVWRNPTSNTPISASEWDSGDTTPDASWTTNPGASAVDSGTLVGFEGFQSSFGEIVIDNAYFGDLP